MRRIGSVLAVVVLTSVAARPGPAAGFDFEDVAAKAQKLAEQAYRPAEPVPEWLRKLDYDQWRDIRFRPERALWRERGSRFEVQFFHPGLFYERALAVNLVDAGRAQPVAFSPSQFDYGKNDFEGRIPQDLGYAGFRIHYPIKTPDYRDEVVVFLGASYFRALGKRQVFGMSARGLAVDTALPSGEEFPAFTEFWLVRPAPSAGTMVVYAILDGPSVAGAYRFAITPGEETTVDVDSRIFPRREGAKLGIAPLTSMFFHGENSVRHFEDFRPEVHDSDGLLLGFDTGEWLWRVLDNPRAVHVSAFQMQHPRGFGLIQRDRDFASYQDLETHCELRPSVWVAPRSDFGEGQVELVQIPTSSDFDDNVVAYWVPKTPPQPGTAVSFSYTMSWYGEDATRPPGGRVVATRRDLGTLEKVHRFVLDFGGKRLAALPADAAVRGVVTVVGGEDAGELVDLHVLKNTVTGGWRLTFQVRPKRAGVLELRAFLEQGGEALTETWSHAILP